MTVRAKKLRLIILSSIIFMITFSSLQFFMISGIIDQDANDNEISNRNLEDKETLKISAYWEFNKTVHIDNNWTDVKTEAWCSGSGTWGDPYIIENITIDPLEIGSCFLIENTIEYFEIRNCTLLNSTESGINGGFIMDNVTNAKIFDNHISDCEYGLYLDDVDNSTIEDNNIRDNENDAIHAIDCEDLVIVDNGLRYNDESGIILDSCEDNVIRKNIIKEHEEYGIRLDSSDENTIESNIIDHNDNYGIYLDSESDDNEVIENYVGYNDYKKDDGECIYIIDKGDDNEIKRNDCVGDCEDDPVYGELDEEEPVSIPGFNLLIFLSVIPIYSFIFYYRRMRKMEK